MVNRNIPIMNLPHENHANVSVFISIGLASYSRRRKKAEEKAKVVADVWGTELIQFLDALDIYHQDDFEEKDE